MDTAVVAGKCRMRAAAIQAAGLAQTLQHPGPFTPADAVFATLPAGTVEMPAPEKSKSVQILTGHVMPGQIMAAIITGRTTAPNMANRDTLAVNATGSAAKANQGRHRFGNGIIHAMDAVLTPN